MGPVLNPLFDRILSRSEPDRIARCVLVGQFVLTFIVFQLCIMQLTTAMAIAYVNPDWIHYAMPSWTVIFCIIVSLMTIVGTFLTYSYGRWIAIARDAVTIVTIAYVATGTTAGIWQTGSGRFIAGVLLAQLVGSWLIERAYEKDRAEHGTDVVCA